MPKYTPLCISRWIVLGPRLWVWPDERSDGRWRWPPSRVGRWVGRLSRVLQGSSVCLVCRVGLLASLIVGSGWAVHCPDVWHLIWLPMADWVWGVMSGVCPVLLVHPTYQDLRGLLHQAYQWSVIGLGVLVVHRWLNVGLSSAVLGSLVVCQRDASRVELESRSGSDGQTTYRVHLAGEFVYEVTPRDEFEKRLVKLDLRWQIVDVWAANIWQTVAQVRERLAQQGVAVAERLVEEAGRQSGLMTIRAHLKEQFVSGPEGLRPCDGYLTEQLFKLMNQLQTQLDQGQVPLARKQSMSSP